MPQVHDNRRGIIAMVLAMLAFMTSDTIVKVVAAHAPYGEVIFVRGVFTVFLMGLALTWLRQWPHIRNVFRARIGVRAMFDAAGAGLFITALVQLPIANLYAILSTTPFLLTIYSVVFLHETVGWRRWSAITAGLIGMLFVIKPDPYDLNLWALVAFGAANTSALRDLVTRGIDAAIPTLVVALASAVAVMLVGLLMGSAETWRALTVLETTGLLVAAAFFSLGTYLIVISTREAELSAIAPFRYTMLLGAGVSGYFVFNEIPDAWTFLGAAIIVAAGLYTLHRERVLRRFIATAETIR